MTMIQMAAISVVLLARPVPLEVGCKLTPTSWYSTSMITHRLESLSPTSASLMSLNSREPFLPILSRQETRTNFVPERPTPPCSQTASKQQI